MNQNRLKHILLLSILHIFLFSCNNPINLYKKVLEVLPQKKSNNKSILLIILNRNFECLSCNIFIQEYLSNHNYFTHIPFENKIIITNLIRSIEKKEFESALAENGLVYPILYNDFLYSSFIDSFSINKNSGGIIIINSTGKIELEASFKDENIANKIVNYSASF